MPSTSTFNILHFRFYIPSKYIYLYNHKKIQHTGYKIGIIIAVVNVISFRFR